MRAATLAEVSTLEETMQKPYDWFVTVHKEVVHFHGLQHKRKEFVKILKNIQDVIAYVQEWTMRYKGAPLDLVKEMKPRVEMENVKVWMSIQNQRQLT